MSGDLIAQYLTELRARLRTAPEGTTDILAEAEDHLRESMAAGLAAGMSEEEAQQAAISAFGSARTVARANRHPAGVLTPLGLAASKAAGVYLITVSAASFAMYLWIGAVISGLGSPGVWAGCGAAGLALLAGHHIARRIRRRRPGRSQVPVKSYPLGVAFSFITFAVILVVLGSVTRLPWYQLPWAARPGALAVAVGYLAQAVWQHRASAA